jgi:hypothetical protein
MKTKLTIEIEYAPEMTDPEGLAYAMDRLLKTAVSTPNILDEYGNPMMGEFLIAKDAANEPQSYILNIDGKAFRRQRELLLKIAHLVRKKRGYKPAFGDAILLEGLVELTDAIADQAHDRHGIDCLLDS